MFDIPDTFKKNNEDYITLAAMKRFIKSLGTRLKISVNREELIELIIEFGRQSEENAEIVNEWIDGVIQEGIKDIYLQYGELSDEMALLFSNKEKIKRHLNNYVYPKTVAHICSNQYDKSYKLIKHTLLKTEYGDKISLLYCKLLYMHDKINRTTKVILYPVIAEYYLETNWLLVRAKPRANLYLYDKSTFVLEDATSTSTEKEIREVIKIIETMLSFKTLDKKFVSNVLKNKLFLLLDKYTQTPQEIINKMNEKNDEIQEIISKSLDACTLPETSRKDIEDDIKNIVEKYLSINWEDKSIFIKDRNAYPVKLSATDEEESKVEQTAPTDEPLQSKAIFFDNKKMLYKNKKCEGITFQWKRKDFSYFPRDKFAVRMSINANSGKCIFKFMEYTPEEDIENVVFSVIGIA